MVYALVCSERDEEYQRTQIGTTSTDVWDVVLKKASYRCEVAIVYAAHVDSRYCCRTTETLGVVLFLMKCRGNRYYDLRWGVISLHVANLNIPSSHA